MKGPQEQYTDEMKARFGYYATWVPGTPLELGDFGFFNDNVFTRMGGLEDFDLAIEVREDNSAENLSYSTKGGVATTVKLSGTVPPTGSVLKEMDAGLIVDFSKENAILFKAKGCKVRMIRNIKHIGEQVVNLYKEGKWNKRFAVITELVVADSATIIISNSNNGKIELKANANVAAGKMDIADAKLDFGIQFSRSLETDIVAEQGLSPLFRIQGIKTNIFTSPVFKNRGIRSIDIISPASARNEHRDEIYFGYLSEEMFE